VAVAVAADPCSQADFRTSERVREKTGIKADGLPRLNQPLIEAGEGEWKNLAKIINDTPALGGDIWFFQKNLAGAPEAFEHNLDLIAQIVSLRGGELVCLTRGEEGVNGAVLLEDSRTFRLGGVCGENGLNADRGKGGGNLFGRHAGIRKGTQLIGPKTRLGLAALLDFSGSARLEGGILLDHIQELESD
jgi:hypothetical protein